MCLVIQPSVYDLFVNLDDIWIVCRSDLLDHISVAKILFVPFVTIPFDQINERLFLFFHLPPIEAGEGFEPSWSF